MITKEGIDSGKPFDWGKTSEDYAKFRDIYPSVFYEKITERGLCVKGQTVLDLGTGTGVLPRNMYRYGAKWIGTDISENQIEQAKRLSEEANLPIEYYAVSAENAEFPEKSFDVITACQCYWYFDHKRAMPKLRNLLKDDGKMLFLYMAWLPFEDEIANASEQIVLKYNPAWTGTGETFHPIAVPDKVILDYFEPTFHEEYRIDLPFTRETWNGRMKACRGVGASLSSEDVARWEAEHMAMLEAKAPESFTIKHYAAMLEFKKKEI